MKMARLLSLWSTALLYTLLATATKTDTFLDLALPKIDSASLWSDTTLEHDLPEFPSLPHPLFLIDSEQTNHDKEETKEHAASLPIGSSASGGNAAGDRIFQGENATSVTAKLGYFVPLLGEDSEGRLRLVCGGALLSPLFVLTAAHCVYDRRRRNGKAAHYLRSVAIGFFGSEHEENQQPVHLIRLRHFYVHPKYDPSFFIFDLAVLELEEPTFRFDPVLPDLGNIRLKLGDAVTTIGLGRVTDSQFPTKLQRQHFNVMPDALCNGWWMSIFRYSTRNTFICTYADYFASGACSGDSGGPVVKVADDANGPDTVVAVVGFGFEKDGCGRRRNRRLPDGNTKVVTGRDDLWGPLVCNSNRTAAGFRQEERLRPAWCEGQPFATMTPVDPIPQNSKEEPERPPDPIDGFEVPPNRYPYMSAIQLQNSFGRYHAFECMGTLIHPYFVLTMAECVNPKFGSFFQPFKVRVGFYCFSASNCGETYHDRATVQVVAHPQFQNNHTKWEMHNVGLIRLDRPVTTDFVKMFPRLDDGKEYRRALRKRNGAGTVRALGFGKTSPDVELTSITLAQLTTTLVKNGSCERRVTRFFDKKYGEDRELLGDGFFGCSNRLSVSRFCLSLFGSHPERMLQWGSPLILARGNETPDIVLGTLQFRTDENCRNESSPDVYHRVSAYRAWIQCVVCVGSINVTLAADLPLKADPLCGPRHLSPSAIRTCRKDFGISLGKYDEELLHQQQMDAQEPEPTNEEVCRVVERGNSTFELNPFTGKRAKCASIVNRGLESLLCGASQVVQDARKQCPHTCGLCT